MNTITLPKHRNVLPQFGQTGLRKERRQHFHHLKQQFTRRHKQAVDKLVQTHAHIKTFLEEADLPTEKIKSGVARALSVGALSSALLLTPVKPIELPQPHQAAQLPEPKLDDQTEQPNQSLTVPSKKFLAEELLKVLPTKSRTLNKTEEELISGILERELSVEARAELEGVRLNASYGYMGSEQHLMRYPGDTVAQHGSLRQVGMAPKRGAFGYFTDSKATLNPETIKREEYYFAVQTWLSPNWRESIYSTKDWLKFRKMIAVNPKTGDVVVGVIGDAGPAVWTGKQFGGSPEAMRDLHLNGGMKNGEVLLFFVDDPDNKIPLGPIQLAE